VLYARTVKTASSVEFRAGAHINTAADPIPDDLC
jgi:hypothetical protein